MNILINLLFTFLLYCFPIILLKYAFIKKRVKKKTALLIIIPFGIIMFIVVRFIQFYTTGYITSSVYPVFIWCMMDYALLVENDKK